MTTATSPLRRFRVLLVSALAVSAVVTPAALFFLAITGTPLRLHLVLSLGLAITLSLLLAAGLMGLLFYSSASGHDQRVADENGDIDFGP